MRRSVMCKIAAVMLAYLAGVVSAAADSTLGTDAQTPSAGPQPLTSPATWIATDDYPPLALREHRGGRVRFRLDVDTAGTVTNCLVLIPDR